MQSQYMNNIYHTRIMSIDYNKYVGEKINTNIKYFKI